MVIACSTTHANKSLLNLLEVLALYTTKKNVSSLIMNGHETYTESIDNVEKARYHLVTSDNIVSSPHSTDNHKSSLASSDPSIKQKTHKTQAILKIRKTEKITSSKKTKKLCAKKNQR